MWLALSDMVHGCMMYTERAEMAAVSCGTSVSAVSTPLWWISESEYLKTYYKKLVTRVESHATAVSLRAENSAI